MQSKLISLAGLGALVLLGASGAAAQSWGPGEGGGPRGLRGPARVLDLTEDQEAAAREICQQRRPERQALREEMRENREALREAMESGTAEPCTVGEIVMEGHALKEKGRALREESKKARVPLSRRAATITVRPFPSAHALRSPGACRKSRRP